MNIKEVTMHMDQMAPLIIDAVSNGKNFLLCPKGTSMLPTIKPDKDYVMLASCENLAKYDIILFKRQNGSYALHRIVKIKDSSYTLCGDNQISFEKGIKKEQIIAKVTAIHKNGGEKIIQTNTKFNYLNAIVIRAYRAPKRLIIRVVSRIKRLKKSER
jgi:hypothetical protein